tara:strand:+ start:104684 stop:105274 length:591 start_codon:yes stop_codon:yes gene_type:complete
MKEDINTIHQFWFGRLDDTGFAAPEHSQLWFRASEETDAALRSRFGSLVTQALAGELNHWAEDDKGLIALVLLLDQFTRNIYRGTPESFAGDDTAQQLVQQVIASGRHTALPPIHQVFLFLPLEHCEDLETQELCVQLFRELAERSDANRVNDFARYAVAHRDVIARFGRFPHRNAILGRESTAEELAYLEKHGGF